MSATPSVTMQQASSSQFATYGHLPELNLLAIQFHPKKSTGVSGTYHYQGVDAAMFAEFLAAESQGSFFIQRIKKYPERFPYQKIEAAPAPTKLTKEALAALLMGREYTQEISKTEEAAAKAAGLLVIFGGSDDLMEFRGAVHDERGYYPGRVALIDEAGLLPVREDVEDDGELKGLFARQPGARAVEALWSVEEGYSWTYRTDVPHATFEIVEDGAPYCRGIVIDVADLAPEVA